MKPGLKPSSGNAMTHAKRQARYRTKQAKACPRSVIANPQIVAAAFRDGAMPLRIYRRSKRLPGLARGRKTWRTVPHQTPCARSVTLIYLNCRASCRRRVLGATEVSHDVIYEELVLRLVIDDQN